MFSITISFGQVTSVQLFIGNSGKDVNGGVEQNTTTPEITLNVPDASATARGVVTREEQTFSGTKTFNNGLVVNGLTSNDSSCLQVNGDIRVATDFGLYLGGGSILGDPNGLFLTSNNTYLQGDIDGLSQIFTNEYSVGVNVLENTSFRIKGGRGFGSSDQLDRMSISPNGNISFNTTDILGLGNGGTFNVSGNTNISGNVGIGGAMNSTDKLAVNGIVHAKEVRVNLLGWPDYVFEKHYTGKSTLNPGYNLPTLAEIESYTKANHHLPEVPSAAEITSKGLKLGEMNGVLLKKIEELTLYAIEQQKEIEYLKKENENYKSLAERLSVIEKELETKK
ncbi:hypothetical protein [Flavobacterium hydrophilum]|nr:hypothetical protein [Flavobacterium hydrophilum]